MCRYLLFEGMFLAFFDANVHNTLKYLIFQLCEKVDICQLGGDQRRVNMLAREYCDDLKKKYKPIILSHRIL